MCGAAGAGDCRNTAGSYSCSCHPGYRLEGGGCVDRDECGEQQLCGRGECRNTEGGYECSCQQGYGFDGVTCFDLDEVIILWLYVVWNAAVGYLILQCLIGNPCVHGVCSNVEGSYECDCHDGFYLQDGECLDLNEVSSSSPHSVASY